MSAKTDTDQPTAQPAPGTRAAVLLAWRAHPDVRARCEQYDEHAESWEVFRDHTLDEGALKWAVPDMKRRWREIAQYSARGLDGLSDAERAIIVEEHKQDGRDIDPAVSKFLIVEDTSELAPIDLPSEDNDAYAAAATAWATEYRARLPAPMRHLGMMVCPRPAEHPTVGLWFGVDQPARLLRKWIREVGGGDFEAPRFRVLEQADGAFVAVEPANVQRASLDDLRAPPRPTGDVTPTGIADLDSLIRLGGTDAGGLTVFVAHHKSGKTLSMLQVAEHRASLGRQGVWIARDESEASIQKRRWQYRGDTEAEAKARVARGEVVSDTLAVTSVALDRALEVVAKIVANGQPMDLYLDSLNSDATGQHEIDELVRKLKATGADLFATAEGTAPRSGSGSMRVKGSTGVAFAADLTVALKYTKRDDAETLTMKVERSRIADDGEFTITVHTAQQRFGRSKFDNARSVSDELEHAKAAVLTAVRKHGTLSGRRVERHVSGYSRERVRAALAALVAAGDLALDGVGKGSKYALGAH